MKIFAQNCLIEGKFVPAVIEIAGDEIVGVEQRLANDSDGECLNFVTGFLVPGLIDLQINGAFGIDFSICSSNEANTVLSRLPMNGTTSICPTVITSPIAQMTKQVTELANINSASGQARSLGVHLEGPVISADKKGAHDGAHLLDAMSLLSSNLNLSDLRIITLAPELPDAEILITQAAKAGVLVSMGHTDATGDQTRDAINLGARMVTHLFNGMREIHQREPGIVVATLLADELHFGLILDGEHVDYDLVRLVQKIAPNRMVVVSDASSAMRSEPGTVIELGGSTVVVDESGNARREDGTLASSGLSQLQAIENAVKNGFDRASLITSATKIPADLLGEKKLGRISVGAFADLVHYAAGDLPKVDFALVGGEVCQF
jgi:N-acetylglucosamine-6-phosphate deacetylase